VADVFDKAQEYDALNLSQGLAAQRARAANYVRPKATGRCLNPECEASPFDNPQRLYCGPECEREHHRLTRH
jgi:hypothetical protein